MNKQNLSCQRRLQIGLVGRGRKGWSLVEVLITATVASALMVFVLHITLQIQHAYQRMNQVTQCRADWWRLHGDLQRDVARDEIGQVRLPERMENSDRSAAVEWSLGDRICRYRYDVGEKRIVREEERSGQVIRREVYRVRESTNLTWTLKSIHGTEYLILQATDSPVPADGRPPIVTAPNRSPTLIVAIGDPLLTKEISP